MYERQSSRKSTANDHSAWRLLRDYIGASKVCISATTVFFLAFTMLVDTGCSLVFLARSLLLKRDHE